MLDTPLPTPAACLPVEGGKDGYREDPESGFTLIELMVVVLIIAILLAIAIPTFLGARDAANARAAQSDLRNALTAEQTEFTAAQAFSANSTTMLAIEANINWTSATSAALSPPNQVSVAVNTTTPNVVLLQAQGKDSNCYYIEQSDDPTHSYTGYAETAGTCGSMSGVNPTVQTTPPTAGPASGHISSSTTPPTSGFYATF